MMAWEQTTPFNGPNTDARDQSSPDRHIRLAPHGRSIHKYMMRQRGPPSQTWRTFLRNHGQAIAAIDLCVVPTMTFERLFAFLIMSHGRRQLLWFAVTRHPTAEWLAQQVVEAFPWETAPTYLVRDNDGAYGPIFTGRVRAMGIRDRPIAPRSPWQNPYVERLIGTLRRDCLDHVLILGERHLRRLQDALRTSRELRQHDQQELRRLRASTSLPVRP
jgi:transposase InsO family protein